MWGIRISLVVLVKVSVVVSVMEGVRVSVMERDKVTVMDGFKVSVMEGFKVSVRVEVRVSVRVGVVVGEQSLSTHQAVCEHCIGRQVGRQSPSGHYSSTPNHPGGIGRSPTGRKRFGHEDDFFVSVAAATFLLPKWSGMFSCCFRLRPSAASDIPLSYIILTLSQPVLALSSYCQARKS